MTYVQAMTEDSLRAVIMATQSDWLRERLAREALRRGLEGFKLGSGRYVLIHTPLAATVH